MRFLQSDACRQLLVLNPQVRAPISGPSYAHDYATIFWCFDINEGQVPPARGISPAEVDLVPILVIWSTSNVEGKYCEKGHQSSRL